MLLATGKTPSVSNNCDFPDITDSFSNPPATSFTPLALQPSTSHTTASELSNSSEPLPSLQPSTSFDFSLLSPSPDCPSIMSSEPLTLQPSISYATAFELSTSSKQVIIHQVSTSDFSSSSQPLMVC